MRDDFDFRVDRKTGKKLLEAMRKGTWNGLTKAQNSALEDLIIELEMQCGGK